MAKLISFLVSSPSTNILPRTLQGHGRILVSGVDTGKDINLAMIQPLNLSHGTKISEVSSNRDHKWTFHHYNHTDDAECPTLDFL